MSDEVRAAVEAERQRAAAHAREGYRGGETCDDITKRILSGEPAEVSIHGLTWGPPVDDVREALGDVIEAVLTEGDFHSRSGRALSGRGIAEVVCDEFEVRLRGTVTPTAAHDRDHMGICRKCGHGLTAREILDGETPCPGGEKVTDAEVERIRLVAADQGRAFLQGWEVRAVLEAEREVKS